MWANSAPYPSTYHLSPITYHLVAPLNCLYDHYFRHFPTVVEVPVPEEVYM